MKDNVHPVLVDFGRILPCLLIGLEFSTVVKERQRVETEKLRRRKKSGPPPFSDMIEVPEFGDSYFRYSLSLEKVHGGCCVDFK